jgi:hypothetical protein
VQCQVQGEQRLARAGAGSDERELPAPELDFMTGQARKWRRERFAGRSLLMN